MSIGSSLVVGSGRDWLGVWLVVALTAALLVGLPSPAGAVAGYGDVPEGAWYTDAVQWSTDNGITDISGFCFGPDSAVSRGETAVWIYNMENRPNAGDRHSFTDITDASQDDAVSWMANNTITTGTSPTTFAPDVTLTRAEVATFLHRLAGEPAAPAHSFVDVVAGWQQGGVSWMAHTGITTGTSPTTFAPEGTLTRAHLITFLYRYQGKPAITPNTTTPHCDPEQTVEQTVVQYDIGDTIVDFPSGSAAASGNFSGALVTLTDNGTVAVEINDGGSAAYTNTTYTCASVGGCTIVNSRVTKGTVNAATVSVGDAPTPDLVVDTATVDTSVLSVGESFTLSAVVRNQGDGRSSSTTLRYYRSTDATITTGDTGVGTDSVFGLDAQETGAESIRVTAPSVPGTYYFGACVDSVSDESDTTNNCSDSVAVTVGQATTGDDEPGPPSGVFGAGDTIPGFPIGFDASSGDFRHASVHVSDNGGMVTITMSDGGTVEYSHATYACVSAAGCVIENGRVASGTVIEPEALGLNIQVLTSALAPTSEEDFKTRFLPYGLAADYYYVDFSGDDRFEETTATYTVGGRYTYKNIGERTATLTQDYDDGNFGGSCETHLVFDTAWTGTLEYSCTDGSTSSQNWRVSEQPILSPPTITPVADTNAEVWISVFDTFGPQETRAYDYRIRATNQEGPPFETCTTVSNSSGQTVSDEARTTISGLLPGTEYEFRYRYRNSDQCGQPVDIEWSHMAKATTGGAAVLQSPMFAEGSSTTRSLLEGTPPGVRVGLPVSARGVPTLTYSVHGSDADSFVVDSDTGQIRTKAGIVYDYETKDQYRIVVRATDPGGGLSDTIDVTIYITDLAPSCGRVQDLRVNPGDERLTLRWNPQIAMDGEAPVLGYQTEIRQSSASSWSDRRVVLGTEVPGLTYVDLLNDQRYEIRVRPVNAEGNCSWSDPVAGTPSGGTAPTDESDLSDRIGDQWVGTPSRHWQILTPGRCRHRTGDTVYDAYCSYQRTDPDSGQISLEFDDPSRGSCDVVFAFSSLTAGSFVDDCWDAGVNTGGLRTDFVVPPDWVRTTTELNELLSSDSDLDTSSLAPRTQEEFDRLARGRRDFIPGVVIGELDLLRDRSLVSPGSASLLKYDNYGRHSASRFAEYRYENIGPSEGLLTITPRVGGETLSFRLGFGGGTMGITVEDSEGDPVDWWAETFPEFAGVPQLADPLPILLPSPPASPINLDGPDLAPQTGEDFMSRFPWDPYSGGWSDIDAMLGPNALYRPFQGFSEHGYVKTDRNRATITLTFGDFDPTHPDRSPALSDNFYEQFTGATWDIDIEFLTDGSIGYTATLSLDGSPTGLMLSGVVDYDGNRMEPDDEFPPETLPPDDPPQARGQDLPGVDLAPANTAGGIGPNDLQPFLLDGADLEQAAYRPGDWLEPKDGSAQRMMIVGVNQVSTTEFPHSTLVQPHHVDHQDLGAQAPRTTIMAYFHGALEDQTQTTELPGLYTGHGLQIQSDSQPTITQLLVVCMQQDREIPIRGARYFSQPKPAEGPVQTCQRNCVLNHREFIQQCVWQCENDDSTVH